MMNEYTNDDHLIEQYLFGDLSGMALQNFEKRMAQDTNFAKHVAVEKSVFSGLEA
ncbi:MAG: anti-sigma-K factor RskA, partial [Paraglaciecola sp.]